MMQPSPDEDDWETADISSFAPTNSNLNSNKPFLRAGAASFQPRAVEASASTSKLGPKPKAQGQRVYAPPGREGFLVDKQGMRADWETRAGNNRAWGGRQVEGDGEDEWFKAGSRGQSNRQLWDEANTQNASNSFQQILSPAPLPPPQIKILRRQNAQSSEPDTSSPTQGPSAPKTYKEKEEQYRLARERIFGPGPGSESSSTSPASASAPNSRGVSPIPNPNPQVHTYPALVPTQVGRVWSGHGNSNTPGGGGVSRQPRGPGDGGGFGSGGGAVGNGNGRGTVPPPLSAERGQGAFPPGW